ncbi:MAG: hypothetical protein LQ338_004209 [Usnochroma carphineum]|nr:MAG: hypothetical protein LQ338_004209 [Usnochroma carphineum]
MLRLLVTVLFGFQLVVAIPTADLTANPSSLRMSRVECVDSDEWKAPNFVKEDCYVAVQDLYRWDVRFRPDLIVTFFSSSHSRPAVLSVQTPKRYVDFSLVTFLMGVFQWIKRLSGRFTRLLGLWRSSVLGRVDVQGKSVGPLSVSFL